MCANDKTVLQRDVSAPFKSTTRDDDDDDDDALLVRKRDHPKTNVPVFDGAFHFLVQFRAKVPHHEVFHQSVYSFVRFFARFLVVNGSQGDAQSFRPRAVEESRRDFWGGFEGFDDQSSLSVVVLFQQRRRFFFFGCCCSSSSSSSSLRRRTLRRHRFFFFFFSLWKTEKSASRVFDTQMTSSLFFFSTTFSQKRERKRKRKKIERVLSLHLNPKHNCTHYRPLCFFESPLDSHGRTLLSASFSRCRKKKEKKKKEVFSFDFESSLLSFLFFFFTFYSSKSH